MTICLRAQSGHIITANTSFLIYPVGRYSVNDTHVLHKIRKCNAIAGM